MLLPLVCQLHGLKNYSMDLSSGGQKSVFLDLKSGPPLEDLIRLASGVVVYIEVEQSYCDITAIDSSNNFISLL